MKRKVLSFLNIIGFLFIIQNNIATGQRCPLHYIVYGNSCYRYIWLNVKTYYDARLWCRSQGGDLLKIDTAQEWTYVNNYITNLNKNARNIHSPGTWWIGMNNLNKQGDWRWVDQTDVNTQIVHWKNPNPNNAGGNEHCVRFETGGLNDRPCYEKTAYVCERARGLPLTCDVDSGWEIYPPNCYKTHLDQQNWNNARRLCIRHGGDLVTIDSKADETTVQGLAKNYKKPLWIGLKSSPNGNTVQWTWLNTTVQSSSVGTYWVNNHVPFVPANRSSSTCVFMSNSVNSINAWQAISCNARRSYVCVKPEGVCQPGWIAHQRHCYQFNIKFTKTWPQAKSFCAAQGTKLVEIYSASDQSFLASYMDELRESDIDSIWIGATDNNSTAFLWSSGKGITYTTPWITRPPHNTRNRQDCAYVSTKEKTIMYHRCYHDYVKKDVMKCQWQGDNRARWRPTSNCLLRKAFMCMANMNQTIKAVSTPRPQFKCDHGWRLHGANCYLFNDTRKSWFDAKTACTNSSANLVKILSSDVQSFIARYTHNDHYWIGLNDQQQEGKYFWTDTRPMTYHHWNPHEPNNLHGENCVENYRTGWNDKDCSAKLKFVCQKVAGNLHIQLLPTNPTYVPYSAKCGYLWEDDPNTQFCYQFHDTQLDWEDARSSCQSQGGDLLSITSREEQFYVSAKLAQMTSLAVWIGANDRGSEGGWRWTDNTPFAYLNWSPGEPNDYHHNEDCAGINTKLSTWNDMQCSKRYGFVCKKLGYQTTTAKTTTRLHAPAGKVLGCPRYWKRHDFSCYQFIKQSLTWTEAKAMCRLHRGYLASIGSQREQNYVVSQIPRGNNTYNGYWIGLNDQNVESSFQWTDGSKVTFTKWAPGEPNNWHGHDEDCVLANVKTGKWFDAQCTSMGLGVVCEQPVAPIVPPPPTGCALISPQWHQHGHMCYRVIKQNVNWMQAKNLCSTNGGSLAKVTSQDVQTYIANRIPHGSSGVNGYWLGINDRAHEGTWVWADGSAVTYKHWQPGEPNQYRGRNEDCGILSVSAKTWYDLPCGNVGMGVVCQHPVPAPLPTSCASISRSWRPHNNNCYQFKARNATWDQARAYCLAQGGDLASVLSQDEQNYIKSQIPHVNNTYNGYWIGLNDRVIEDSFEWTDTNTLTYTNWQKGEPNSWLGHNEDCGLINVLTGGWFDASCTAKGLGLVCKRGLPSATPDPSTVGCDAPGTGYQGTCYTLIITPKTWQDANNDCVQNYGGTLATISDRFVQAYIASTLENAQGYYWVGMSDKTTPGTYTWSSGTTVDFTFWHNTHTGNERGTCVALRTTSPIGLWENKACTETHPYICQSLRSGYTTPPQSTISSVPCPTGWIEDPNHRFCYKVFYNTPSPGKQTWTQARDFCKTIGGDLMSVHNAATETFLKTTVVPIGKYTGSLWIGLNDRDTEAGYVWSDNSGTDYTDWNPGEPNNFRNNEDCVTYDTHAQGWNDYPCFASNNFICQLTKGSPLLTTTPLPTGAQNPACGASADWEFYNNQCYLLSPANGTDAMKSWQDASTYCRTNGGYLASVHSQDENNFLVSLTSAHSGLYSFWIGYNILNTKQYSWSDQTPSDFTRWNSGEPNNFFGSESCANFIRTSGGWNDENCNNDKGFICKKILGAPPPTPRPTTAIVGGCSHGSPAPHSSKCYYIGGYLSGGANSGQLNWTAARSACQALGSGYDIGSINSADDQAFVNTMLLDLPSMVWIGLNNKFHQKHFIWPDNSYFHYTNWAPGEPNGHTTDGSRGVQYEECTQMFTSSLRLGLWNDKTCDYQSAYLCQGQKNPSLPVTSMQGSCNPDYIQHDTSCYQLFTTIGRNWNDANAACQAVGGSLIIVNDIYENAFVTSMFPGQNFWMGLSFSTKTNSFNWALNWPLIYTSWGVGEPTQGPTDGCVSFDNGYWNDTSCNQNLPYLCEINSVSPPAPTMPYPGHCTSDDQVLFGDSCYYFDLFHGISWPEAGYYCSKRGMTLASIHSDAELNFILERVQNLQPDKNDPTEQQSGTMPDVWIGLNKGFSDDFAWTDNTALNYVNWAPNEPSDALQSSKEECVQMYRTSGKWNDMSCVVDMGYVCKSKAIGPTTPSTTLPTTASPNPNQQPVTQAPNPGVTINPGVGGGTVKPLTTYAPPDSGPQTPAPTYPSMIAFTPAPVHSLQRAQKSSSGSSGGLSGGGVAGIIIAVILVMGIVGVVLIFVKKRSGPVRLLSGESAGFDNALYSKSQQSVNIDPTKHMNGNNGVMSGIPGEEDDA